ncbi:MAG: PadR family transcriptional regulator [Candidatus Eremiobacteraeota bacterium]|nr:PadR family transcriptional regulator [Candidatus Eremiobacteraeota bacterium]
MTLNATSASLLGFLHREPMSGYQLVSEVENSIGYFWNVTKSQIYREIKVLAENRFIILSKSGVRDKRLCTITAAGRSAFRQWIAHMPAPELIRFPLLLTLFFGDRVPPAELRVILKKHRAQHAERLSHYEDILPQAESYEPYPALTLRFGLYYERAVLEWFDSITLPPKRHFYKRKNRENKIFLG